MQKRVNAIMTTSTRPFFAERKRIVELSNKHRLPAIYFSKEIVDVGGLMFYGADCVDLYRRADIYFEFVVNLKAAKQIGLAIPVRVLERANQVIR